MKTHAPVFPITPLLPQICEALATHSRLVLEAPPGAGKTTQVPLALLDAPWLAGRKIIVLEPRRIAVRSAAQFMATQLGELPGQTIGYRIRFEAKVSAATRIEVVTEGILTRMIQDDPELTGIGAIVFDEFHERHLAGDFGAVLALEVQATLRPDLRLLVMSATLDGQRISQWLQAPRLSSPGRSYPVRIEHPPARAQERLEHYVSRVAKQALLENPGDVLVFLPGRREIVRVQDVLRQSLMDTQIDVLPLHGELSMTEQQLALAPAEAGCRRIVLATNVAESSITLPGIRAVIDAGLAREPRFDPQAGFTRLDTVTISQASADQRAGRAGRVAEGVAYRLWPQSQRLEPSRSAEIQQADLSALALELAAWGITGDHPGELRWLDAPPPGALSQARELLVRLGALASEGRIQPLGSRLLALGASPRLAAAALRAPLMMRPLVADLLALMDARSPMRGSQARSDDFRVRLAALHAWRDRRNGSARIDADTGALAAIEQVSKGWRRRLEVRTPASGDRPVTSFDRDIGSGADGVPDSHSVGDLLLHAFPDRVARQDPQQPFRYTLANGRGARLHENTALLGEPWLVILELRLESRDSLILAAAPFDPGLLEQAYPQQYQRQRVVRWNDEREAVEAFEEQRFDAIMLDRRSVPVDAADALPALLAAIRAKGIDCLPWGEISSKRRARVQWLREWMPELGLPDLSDTALTTGLDDWLGPYLEGKHRLDALGSDVFTQALASLLSFPQQQALDKYAPDALRVPSGRHRALDYLPGQPPVLAVKLQELFGLGETPTVASGKVAVTLHLLSPARRPIQVTQDLRGFWERTYPEVKKELKGRYPRHPWPDDPWNAVATERANARKPHGPRR